MLQFILIVVIAAIVISVVRGIAAAKKVNTAKSEILKSPKFQAITNQIFSNGQHPSRIVITFNSEIFYGPIEGRFVQVPGSMVPVMDETQRRAVGGAIETTYGYRYNLCNSGLKSGFGAAPADTGEEYIDSHADILLISAGSKNAGW